jgi:glycosyltransferase involved in cell wall biosynthesis
MNLCFLGDIRQVHVQKFIRYFAKDNETHLISLDYIGDERVEQGMNYYQGIGTHIHLLKKSRLYQSPFIAKSFVKKINPDLVQAHFITNYGFLAAFAGVHPLVICAQGDDILIHPWQSMFYRGLVTFALNRADHIICDGYNELKHLDLLGIPKNKTDLIYPGIDMQLFHPSKRIAPLYPTVFYPRGFDKIYDTDTLFETIKIVHQVIGNVHFVLMGIGSEYTRFQENVRNSELKHSVTYLGAIPNNEIPQHLASSDISITTATSDGGIPVSTIEAMACGVPVISTDAGDARDWIQDGISGYVVNQKDSVGLAYSAIDLLLDPIKRARFGTTARNFVQDKYDYKTEMKKVSELYSKLNRGD